MQLLTPYTLCDHTLRSRIVMAPMTRQRATLEHVPTALMARYYVQRAGAALIVTEATSVSAGANGWLRMPGIYNAGQIDGWRKLVAAVHQQNTPIFLQLQHCGRHSHSSYAPDGAAPAAPSPIALRGLIHTPQGKLPFEKPHALTVAEIDVICADFRRAAAAAREAGFDGIELAAGFGNLLDTFLQSTTNLREDEFGGELKNRTRLLRRVLDELLAVYPRTAVGVRITPNSPINDMGAPDNPETFLYTAALLREYRLAYLHVTDGPCCGIPCIDTPVSLRAVKAAFGGTVIANGGYTAESANAALEAGDADLITFGTAFISNPDLPERIARGWPLNPGAEMWMWYSPGPEGYIDFPVFETDSRHAGGV